MKLHDSTVVELVDAIRRRDVSPVALTEHYLERIAVHGAYA